MSRFAQRCFLIVLALALIVGCGESAQEIAQRHYLEGRQAAKKRDYQQAFQKFTAAIQADPKMVNAYRSRGLALEKTGQLDKAMDEYTKSVEIDPQYVVGYLSRGKLHFTRGEYQQAIENMMAALKIQPRSAYAYRYLGRARFELGDLAQALEDLNQAVSMDKDNAAGYYRRGLCRFAQGDYAGASTDFQEAIWYDSKHADAYCRRGWAYYELGNDAAAIDDSKRAIKLNPKWADAHFNLARIYATSPKRIYRDPLKAIEHGKLACNLTDRKNWYCLAAYASALAEGGKFRPAIKVQQMAIKRAPADERQRLQEPLAHYRQRKPWRRPARQAMTHNSEPQLAQEAS